MNLTYPADETESLNETMESILEKYIGFYDLHLRYLGLTVEDLKSPPEMEFSRESAHTRLVRATELGLNWIFKNRKGFSSQGYGNLSPQWFRQKNDITALTETLINHGNPKHLTKIFFSDWLLEPEREVLPILDWLQDLSEELPSELDTNLKEIKDSLFDTSANITSPLMSVASLLEELIEQGVITPPPETS